MKEDTTFRDAEILSYRNRTFDRPLDKLTITDFTKMASWMGTELGYDPALFLYIHETMRQYVAVRRGTNSSLTGRDVYNRLKAKAPKLYNKIAKKGKLTLEDAREFRDNGWKTVPECM